ncbi:Prolipoprotein diacylglyceryl transferase [mine drainage metagenome]|uniref:Prolipoprotein diacylglyceryl transferase n=1 Tax=mine drainage metagenome TaxID=410659 RepID=T0Z002_9ZZZZ
MAASGLFLLLYGIFRFTVEFVRLPDPQLGYLAWGLAHHGTGLVLPDDRDRDRAADLRLSGARAVR